ncbi:glutathione S-transferase N-terminal domain-containing protein [Leptospira bandrabouensis]|uniref:Glutathione S-transferase n=1 Tax=Leptospira bandrabouensis TaxID=2484903 RepID=A0A6H3NQ97_9LEPT|nr:glutathione S-transferase N-terminal domain-containing protein [Leptospira bandrabouensis]MCG6151640.1 glutathione S-transferase N-terminal domain-containing protein [Leptospira bandrabouensis]MCW7458232.1 glutathione S-transferase N-terminal domain-containing protein [Leptospira bandrabouensis]MCW7476894.1 glutathione S-transferase N-terminal domain-containing protein [Leptospira bandrabouensis]MCW7484576.1 glutathione S-transferase N-terminal domain-containing protein [Leptospira bandrabou
MTATLYTFPISHFSEKARWALDLANYDYKLNPLVPGQHIQTLKPLVNDLYVPVLETETGIIQGSGDILDFVEEKAFGHKASPEEKQMEEKIDTQIGKSLQTLLYHFILDYPEIVGKLFLLKPASPNDTVGAPEHFDLIALSLKRRYKITPKNLEVVKQSLDECSKELIEIYKSRKFFNGTSFGRVDLTLASLMGMLSEPKESPAYPWFASVQMPESFLTWRKELGFDLLFDKIKEFYRDFRIQSK